MRQLSILFLAALLPATAGGQAPPAGYYDTVDTSSSATLRTTLHAVIDDHQRYPYSSSSTDTWNILEEAMEDPNNPARILDVYRNESFAKAGGGNTYYNREHPWPSSYGFPDDTAGNYPYTDCHVLMLCDDSYNTARGNNPYGTCWSSCNENVTVFNNGQGGGSGSYPGNSNWQSGSGIGATWETWIGRRGDVARALLYLDVRYEGGTHGVTGHWEPDLILTDSLSLLQSTSSNQAVAYMGRRATLLQWHLEDPVDDWERNRNHVVWTYQGNRNPFIDHPEWVGCLFNGNCAPPQIYQPFCFGDGSDGVFCPCLNIAAAGSEGGCVNALGAAPLQGAILTASGTSVVANDDLVLTIAHGTPNDFGIFAQNLSTRTPLAFYDGSFCLATTADLLRIFPAYQMDWTGHGSNTTSLVTSGGAYVAPGVTLYYQGWYRDGGGPCGTGANFSNAVEITWQ